MSLFLLDTDHFTLYQMGHPQVLKNIVQHLTDQLAITVITVEEQLTGWQRALRLAKDDARREQIYLRMALVGTAAGVNVRMSVFPCSWFLPLDSKCTLVYIINRGEASRSTSFHTPPHRGIALIPSCRKRRKPLLQKDLHMTSCT